MTNSVIAKNEPKNTNVKSFKKPKKLKNLNILSLKIIKTKQYMCVCVCERDYTTKKYRERQVTFKGIICGYSCWNLLDNFRSCKKKKKVRNQRIKC